MSADGTEEQQPTQPRGRVALLQNQSEMRHNAWADATTQLRDARYEPILFTSESVQDLASALASDRFDALMIGSNACNDQTIWSVLQSDRFREALDAFLAEGRGLIVMHQMGLAVGRGRLALLRPPWDVVEPVVREGGEEAQIAFAPGAQDHPIMQFPLRVDPERIVAHAKAYSPLRAAWFHAWGGVGQDAWTPLLLPGDAADARALVAVARDPGGRRRIALCAPPADWQRPPALLPNLLFYACRGTRPAAIVGPADGDPGLGLVEIWLASERTPLARYNSDQPEQLALLRERLRCQIHETVLLGPGLAFDDLGADIRTEMEEAVGDGRLRLLGFGEVVAGRHRLWAASSRLTVADVFAPLEAQAVKALDSGRVDGSFWSTVETLQALQEMQGPNGAVDPGVAAPAIRSAASHLRDGSYDETPAVTCALLWLLHTFGDPREAQTADWLHANVVNGPISDAFAGEAIMALTTLARTGHTAPGELERLGTLLDAAPAAALRVHDLLIALDAALVNGHPRADEFAAALIAVQDPVSGGWVDVETTASVIKLLAALHEPGAGKLERSLARASFHVRQAARLNAEVPWAERISTSLLCLRALTLVNEILDIPIGDTVDALRRERQAAEFRNAGEAAARAAEALRESNAELRATKDAAEGKLRRQQAQLEQATRELETKTQGWDGLLSSLQRTRRVRNWLWIALAAAVYLTIAVIVAAVGDRHQSFGDLLTRLGDGLGYHLTMLGVLLATALALEQLLSGSIGELLRRLGDRSR